MRLYLAVLALALLLSPVHAGFQQVYHKFDMSVREDGTAHVLEEFQLYMDSNASSNFYDSIMALSDISAWKNVTSLENLRVHMDTKYASISDLRLRAQRRQGCNPWTGTCYGIVRLEYDVANAYAGSFMAKSQSQPRTSNYTFNPLALSFGVAQAGDVSLLPTTELTINIPQGSVITALNPVPDYIPTTALPLTGVSQLKWSGPSTLASMELSFSREDELSTEVIEFFRSMQRGMVEMLGSREGIALVVMVVIGLASLILLRRYREPQA
jgi:hypothetical protein